MPQTPSLALQDLPVGLQVVSRAGTREVRREERATAGVPSLSVNQRPKVPEV